MGGEAWVGWDGLQTVEQRGCGRGGKEVSEGGFGGRGWRGWWERPFTLRAFTGGTGMLDDSEELMRSH